MIPVVFFCFFFSRSAAVAGVVGETLMCTRRRRKNISDMIRCQ